VSPAPRGEESVRDVVNSLHDFFDRYVRGGAISLVYDEGLRTWTYSYDQVRATATRFSARLAEAGLRQGDRVAIWSESRPEWVAATVVPVRLEGKRVRR